MVRPFGLELDREIQVPPLVAVGIGRRAEQYRCGHVVLPENTPAGFDDGRVRPVLYTLAHGRPLKLPADSSSPVEMPWESRDTLRTIYKKNG